MKKLTLDVVCGYIRHLLTGLGGALVAQGELTNQQDNAIIGGVIALIGVAWSHYSKWKSQSLNQKAK